MDTKTIASNLMTQMTQLSNTVTSLYNISNNILTETDKDNINIDIIKSYVAAADVQITALNAYETMVQGLLDTLSSLSVTKTKSSK